MNRKAIALFSGGLDSMLACRLVKELGIDVIGIHYYIEFALCGGRESREVKRAAERIGIPLQVIDITDEYLKMFKNPLHGYGANINPCIDCKIFMLKDARKRMEELGASFLITGEVLGERPMSQRKDALNIIERDAGVRGILLRPLSAKLLLPTVPEKEGIIDRERLLAISGRSRKEQFLLAEKFGIKEYPNPSGGCLLTDPGFTKRVKDIISSKSVTKEALVLLKWGRHFRLSEDTKLIIGRDEKENDILEKRVKSGDVTFLIKDRPGPFSILRGERDERIIKLAASLVAGHTKYKNEDEIEIVYSIAPSKTGSITRVRPATTDTIEKYRL